MPHSEIGCIECHSLGDAADCQDQMVQRFDCEFPSHNCVASTEYGDVMILHDGCLTEMP